MNKEMLKFLVKSANKYLIVDGYIFKAQYPDDQVTRDELAALQNRGYLEVDYASGIIIGIRLKQKAKNGFI